MTDDDAVLHGGPADGRTMPAHDDDLLVVQVDDMAHRNIRTTGRAEAGGVKGTVYRYDGVVERSRREDRE